MDGTYKIRHEFTKIRFLFRFFVVINFLHILNIYREGASFLWTLILLLGSSLYFYLYNKTFNKLNYSFWTFSILFGVYLIINGFYYLGSYEFYTLVLMAMLFASVCYSVNSPIYFPRVRWWEYDFRYKGDLKTFIHRNGEEEEARLYDLRRGAGCLTLFNKIEPGEKVLIKLRLGKTDYEFHVQIVTSRSNSIGRGYVHGVRFNLGDAEEQKRYNRLARKWRWLVRKRIREKFNESDK